MLLHNVKLNYPSAREWMWDYCVYLGSYEYTDDITGKEYLFDLGVYVHPSHGVSAAIVYGNEAGDYKSGELTEHARAHLPEYAETYKRAQALGLV